MSTEAEPESAADPRSGPVLASRDQRWLAAAVDAALDGLALGVGAGVGVVGASLLTDAYDALLILTLAWGARGLVRIMNWWLIASAGQTVGKRWVNIRIARLDGSRPGFLHGVVLRTWLPGIAGFAFGVLWIIDVLAILRSDQRAIHDHLARTLVVRCEG